MNSLSSHGESCACFEREQAGFTIFEVLLVLGLIAILAGAAAPSLAAFRGGLELRAAALQLASGLVRARLAALADGVPWDVRVSGASSFEIGAAGGAPATETFPGLVSFARTTSGGDVRFHPTGRAENATFTLARNGHETEVVVNQRGRITVRDEGAQP